MRYMNNTKSVIKLMNSNKNKLNNSKNKLNSKNLYFLANDKCNLRMFKENRVLQVWST